MEKKDAELAVALIQYAYFKKVFQRRRRRKRKEGKGDGTESGSDVDSDDETSEEEEEGEEEKSAQSRRSKRSATEAVADDEGDVSARKKKKIVVSPELLAKFQSKLSVLFAPGQSQLALADVEEALIKVDPVCADADEVRACVDAMAEQNRVMLSGAVLYRI